MEKENLRANIIAILKSGTKNDLHSLLTGTSPGPVAKNCATIIYKVNSYRLAGSANVMSKEEVKEYTKNMNAVLFLPENGRDKI